MSEGLGAYLEHLFEAWLALGELGDMGHRLLFFAALLGLTLLCRGRGAWSKRASLGVLATVALFHLNFLVMPLLLVFTDGLRAAYDGLGVPRLPAEAWSALPVWAVALVALVVYDLANYWIHRLLHMRVLWPVHAIHHSDPDVNGLTAYRVHFLEPVFMVCSYVVLLGWLSLPADALGVLGTLLVLHNLYVHADLDWTHGPLDLLVASPRFHRWHHADVPAAHGKNLATIMPLFDRVFGTYHCPGPCDVPLGAAGVPEHNPLKLYVYPFVAWAADLRRAAAWLVRAGAEAVRGLRRLPRPR